MKKVLITLLSLTSFATFANDLYLNCKAEVFERAELVEKKEYSVKMKKKGSDKYHIEAEAQSENGRFTFNVVANKNQWQDSASNIGMRISIYDSVKDVENSFNSDQKRMTFTQFDGKLSWPTQKTDGYWGVCFVGDKEYSEVSM